MIIKSLVALCWGPNELFCSGHLFLFHRKLFCGGGGVSSTLSPAFKSFHVCPGEALLSIDQHQI